MPARLTTPHALRDRLLVLRQERPPPCRLAGLGVERGQNEIRSIGRGHGAERMALERRVDRGQGRSHCSPVAHIRERFLHGVRHVVPGQPPALGRRERLAQVDLGRAELAANLVDPHQGERCPFLNCHLLMGLPAAAVDLDAVEVTPRADECRA